MDGFVYHPLSLVLGTNLICISADMGMICIGFNQNTYLKYWSYRINIKHKKMGKMSNRIPKK